MGAERLASTIGRIEEWTSTEDQAELEKLHADFAALEAAIFELLDTLGKKPQSARATNPNETELMQ